MVTLQQIAEKAGVSRGTVDRALNHRGRINPEVAERIISIANEMGYQVNRAGRALAMAKRLIKIGVIIQSTETPFMQRVVRGAEEAKENVDRLGAEVIIKKLKGVDAEKTMRAMESLRREGAKGIALTPVDDDALREKINKYSTEYQIPIVTFNSDIADTERICYVGQEPAQSGKTAAGLMAEVLPENGKVLIISGYISNRTHKLRVSGFINELKKIRKDACVLDVQYAYDDRKWVKKITEDSLKEHKELAGIYTSSAGVDEVCSVLENADLDHKIKVISNDLIPQNIRYLKKGTINFLIGQDAYTQGHEPVMILFECCLEGKLPENEYRYTEIEIKTKYNM